MKKFFATILALVMVCTVAVTAFAATSPVNYTDKEVEITVAGKYTADTYKPDVISADVSWDDMTFTYSGAGSEIWNPQEHKYNKTETAGWAAETKNITVVNHSNVALTATLSFAKSSALTDLTSNLDTDHAMKLATAENTAKDAGPSETFGFKLTAGSISADANIGVITVALAKTAD